MDDLIGHSVTYRVAVGPRAGQKVFAPQIVLAQGETGTEKKSVAQYAGFSLHAGTAVEGEQREKLGRLARYVTRPAVAAERLSLTPQGHVRYRLKTAYRHGTTHVVFEPDCGRGTARKHCGVCANARKRLLAAPPRNGFEHCGKRFRFVVGLLILCEDGTSRT
jgi:Putative transposase